MLSPMTRKTTFTGTLAAKHTSVATTPISSVLTLTDKRGGTVTATVTNGAALHAESDLLTGDLLHVTGTMTWTPRRADGAVVYDRTMTVDSVEVDPSSIEAQRAAYGL